MIIFGAQRHSPDFFACRFARGGQSFRRFLLDRVHAGMMMTKRNDNRTGQRRKIDHGFRLFKLLRIPQYIGQNEAPFSVRVENLNGLTGSRGENIAGADRVPVRHVFNEPDKANDIGFGFAFGKGKHCPGDGCCAPHIAAHIFHASTGLERDAARVKANPFADKRNRLFAFFTAIPAHDCHFALFHRALPDTEQRAHAEFFHFLFAENFDLKAMRFEGLQAFCELRRKKDIWRLVDQIAGKIGAIYGRVLRSKDSLGCFTVSTDEGYCLQTGKRVWLQFRKIRVEPISGEFHASCNLRGGLVVRRVKSGGFKSTHRLRLVEIAPNPLIGTGIALLGFAAAHQDNTLDGAALRHDDNRLLARLSGKSP